MLESPDEAAGLHTLIATVRLTSLSQYQTSASPPSSFPNSILNPIHKDLQLSCRAEESHLLTVEQSAAWNWSSMVRRAGSMYQMLANMKEMMERLAMLHTTPISTSSSHAVR